MEMTFSNGGDSFTYGPGDAEARKIWGFQNNDCKCTVSWLIAKRNKHLTKLLIWELNKGETEVNVIFARWRSLRGSISLTCWQRGVISWVNVISVEFSIDRRSGKMTSPTISSRVNVSYVETVNTSDELSSVIDARLSNWNNSSKTG